MTRAPRSRASRPVEASLELESTRRMAAPPPPRRLRVLCLHGFRTNAAVMANQTKGLRAALGDRAEFIFLNGPRVAGGPSEDKIEQLHAEDKPFYEWMLARKFESNDKAWNWEFKHFEHAVTYMDAKLKEIGPVDIVVGFSQGALLLTVLSMLYIQRKTDPTRWWKLCICVGGVAVRAVNVRSLFESPSGRKLRVPYPSIHIVGKRDIFYKDGLRLAGQYDDFPTTASSALSKRVYVHEAGHKFPSADKNPGLYEDIAALIVAHFDEAAPPVARL